jgi:hypothetical protein
VSELCHCGKPLHYNSKGVEAFVRKKIAELGETMPVSTPDENGRVRTWKVPRHYIALHGLKAQEILLLGFEELVN